MGFKDRLRRLEGRTPRSCSHCGGHPRISLIEDGEWPDGPPCERWPHPECRQLSPGITVIEVAGPGSGVDGDAERASWP